MAELCPGVDVSGCLFYLCKLLDFNVKKLGLITKYQADFDFKLCVKKLAALAFLCIGVVLDPYETLADTFEDDELPFLTYFEATWVG